MDFSMERRRFLSNAGKTVLAAGIGGALLQACGGGSSSGPVTLTFGWWSNTPAKDNAMRAWIKDFEKAHSNITIKPEILPWTNYWDKLKTTTAGNKAYDIIGLSSGMAAPYFDAGALADLTQFSDYQDASKNLIPASISLSKWEDQVYSLPIGTSISVLGYNKDLLDAAGVPAPDPVKPMTFDQFKAMASKLSKKENGKYTQYAIVPTDILNFDVFTRLNGGQTYDNPVNPKKVTMNTPEGIKGLMDYKSLFDENLAPPYDELENGPWSFDLGSLETGKIAFARVGAWLFSDMMKKPSYRIAPLFTIKNGVSVGGVNSLGVFKGSSNQDAAWEFIKWAVQTQPEISFAKFSDIPADQAAFNQLDSYIQPKDFAPTLQTAIKTFQPDAMSVKEQLQQTLNDVITDMMHNKLTPAQAAAKMEKVGNDLLASS